jgi:hypothetical protein
MPSSAATGPNALRIPRRANPAPAGFALMRALLSIGRRHRVATGAARASEPRGRDGSSHFLSSHWFHRSMAWAALSAHHLSLIQNCFFKLLGSVGRSGAIFGSMYWIESAFNPG